MQLHELRLQHKLKKKKRVGRGGKRGSSSGKGMRGQISRSGRRLRPVIRDVIKRYPKLRGYKFKPQKFGLKLQPVTVNLEILEKKFAAAETVSPQTLLEKRIISKIKGVMPKIKILGKGEIAKPLTFENCAISESAKKKIEKAKGEILLSKKKESSER